MNKYVNLKYYENFDFFLSDVYLDNKNIYWKLLKYIVFINFIMLNEILLMNYIGNNFDIFYLKIFIKWNV